MVLDDGVRRREVLLVAGAAAVQVGGPLLIAQVRDQATLSIGGVVLLALGVAAIPLRLVAPVAALVVAFGSTLAYVTLDDTPGPIWIGLLITFGNVVVTGHRRVAVATLVAGFLGFQWLGSALGRNDPPGLANTMALAAWLLVLYTACELWRVRRERARDTARSQADVRRRQVADERLAIARELHDVVAHNMSLIHLQAGVALHVEGEVLGPQTREALQTIKAASKDALVELRSILGVLRHADVDGEAPRAPAPGLAALHDLVGRARSAGAAVTVHSDVDTSALPRAVDLAAYRIVQESLTNVARHAEPPIATVSLRADSDVLVVSVTDAGRGTRRLDALPSGGNGLPGMRERAAAVGGTLAAGPRLSGGYFVEARLPLVRS